jgi:X-Pro dipeptidyl-peptidase
MPTAARPTAARLCAAVLLAAALLAAGPLTTPAVAVPSVDPGPAADPATAASRPSGTQPRYSYAEAIRETVYVETGQDSDHDGRRDRMHADVIRPRETATAGLKVPVIYEMSPYRAGGNDVSNHDVDVELWPGPGSQGAAVPADAGVGGKSATRRAKAAGSRTADPLVFPGYYDNYFVPRGYAVVLAEGPGTGQSDGCPDVGGRTETAATVAVVQWLTGRAKAYGADGRPVSAGWSTGDVGMIGVSYNATLPNAAAATGVPGLRTIVPIAGISSWYDYYRANGSVVAPGGFQGEDTDVLGKYVLTRQHPEVCADAIAELERRQDRVTGDYSAFWAQRDYLRDVGKVKASVFAVHGLNDWNVRTKHVAQWYDALGRRGVPRKIWLHQGGHLSPFSLRQAEWLDALHRWFDQWLYGIDTGIMREPMASIERTAGQWEQHRSWPDRGARPTRLWLGPGSGGGPGTIGPRPAPPGTTGTITDDATLLAGDLAADPDAASSHRLAFLTGALPAPVRMSGTGRVTVRASVDNATAANLTALLVDYGEAERVDYDAGLEPTGEVRCYGESVPGDSGCAPLFRHATHTTPYEIVTRGWSDPQNRTSAAVSKRVEPGQVYTFRWDLQAEDYVFTAGHRIGVVLLSSDHEHTLRPAPGTRITVDLSGSAVDLPLVR